MNNETPGGATFVYSLCVAIVARRYSLLIPANFRVEWQSFDAWTWAPAIANSWRSTCPRLLVQLSMGWQRYEVYDDIQPNWTRITEILNNASFIGQYTDHYAHNDLGTHHSSLFWSNAAWAWVLDRHAWDRQWRSHARWATFPFHSLGVEQVTLTYWNWRAHIFALSFRG